MEIVAKISQKSIIEYNKEEIEKELKVIEEKYTGLTFTEEQLGEAKEERALNCSFPLFVCISTTQIDSIAFSIILGSKFDINTVSSS